MQYLCLFALLSIQFYPKNLNLLYNAQTLFNFNFIPIDYVSFLNFIAFKNDEVLEGNMSNHPSLNGFLLFNNIISFLTAFLSSFLILSIAQLLFKNLGIKIKKIIYWNEFIALLYGSFIDILLVVLTQIILVNFI